MSKDKQLIIICLLTLIVALVDIPEVGAIAPDPRVRLEPVSSVVGLNETFAVQVMIEEVNDLGAFQFELAYDSSILQVKEATLGDFLGSTGRSVVPIGPEVDNEEGRTTLGAISLGSGPGPSGTGVLATITFIAQGEGSTVLGLVKVQVLDTAANVQLITVEGGQVVVRGAATPTPVARATRTPTSTPEVVATPTPAATALPSPMPSATGPAAETPTRAPSPSPTPSVTSPTVETPTEALAPSPTPSITSPTVETPTKAPLPSPTPSLSIAPTETWPTEVTTPLAVPSVEATQSPVAVPPAPTSTPSTLPSPSPTPLATIPAPAPTGPSGWVVLGPLLAALAVAILAALVLRRRPEG